MDAKEAAGGESIAPAVFSTSLRTLPMPSIVPSKPPGLDKAELIRTHYRMQVGRFISRCQEVLNGVIVRSEISEVPMWNHAACLVDQEKCLAAFACDLPGLWTESNRRPMLYVAAQDAATNEIGPLLRDL